MKSDHLVVKIVNRYIGVEGGYLGDFTYRSHRDFYPEYCDLEKDPDAIEGTTRERFIEIFKTSTPNEQAKIIRGVIDRFPVGEKPKTRTAELHAQLAAEAKRLEQTAFVDDPNLVTSGDMVLEILSDARTLIEHRNVASAIDRVHTAFHGYLRTLCDSEGVIYVQKDDLVKLTKLLFAGHPKLTVKTKSQEVQNIVRNLVSISDSLNPIRNQGSRAHPNPTVLDEAEAVLVVNTVYSVLTYLEAKVTA